MRVGIVGTGEMGRPLIDRLLGAGHSVRAYARRTDVRNELALSGATVVDDVRSIATDADIVIIYVYSDEQVRELSIDGGIIDAMRTGSILVVHTTGSPDTAVVLANLAANQGIAVIDAPGTGGPTNVAEGTFSLFVGANDDALNLARPLFDCYSERVVHCGPIGSGQRMKLLNNLLFGAHVQFATEVGRLCKAMGLDEQLVLTSLHGSSGGSAAIDMAASMGSSAQLLAIAGRFVHKDVLVALALAADLDVDLGTLGPVTERILELTDEGTSR